MISVSDSGIGMDPETQARIFEPFFTTKEKGTGLGLSTVFGIIKQSGGHIWVYSELGRGTRFKIYLPRTDGETTVDLERRPAPKLADGNATVMLVEDETLVRRAAARILRRHGFEVIEAKDGEAALTLFEDRKLPIDVLITDVVLPKMDGPELARRVSKSHPETRVVFTSGYAESALLREGINEEGVFLPKPFTPETLLSKIQVALERAPSRR
jgi:CheY-like chemotaxis protein